MAPKLDMDNIRALKVLGKGATGTVFLAHDISSDPTARSPFALKVVQKSSLPHRHKTADRRARWEMSVLSGLEANPFLPSLLGSFEAHDLLGWALPFCPGGDLNALRYQQTDHAFSQSAIKFYLAEIVCALDHLHSMRIVYRDLKPENVLVQSSGHVILTDFDLSKKLSVLEVPDPAGEIKQFKPKRTARMTRIFRYGAEGNTAKVSPETQRKMSFACGERSDSFVGTEEYVSPEVVRGEAHAYGVDWWALGVLAYEMTYGKTPFRGKNRKETYRNILMKRPEFVGKRTALMDLIERLLEKDPIKRLGYYRGAEEIKEHEFFNGLRWDLLTEVVRPPFVPSTDDGGSSTENPTTFDIREYFQKMRAPPSMPSSPSHSLSSDDDLF
uniref:non-specific serine/threonine protein kinase n=1 Tax=Opuntia streptacantha TaxID=393608 RepID=A0A7C9ALQ8_OPUST